MNLINNIIYLFKFYFSKNSKPFYLPIFLGILYKLNSIALFLIPIQAIKSVSEGSLSNNLKDLLRIIRIPIPPDQYIYIYFLIIILTSLLTLSIFNKLINRNIINIKMKLTLKSKNFNYQLTKSDYYKFNKILKKVDNIIDNSQNFFFCLILSLFIIFYDIQISLILISGGLSYFYLLKLSNKNNFFKKNFNQLGIKEDKNKSFYYKVDNKIKINSYNDLLYMPLISTLTMLLIMTAVYLRVDSGISILFIFLIRIFQSNMLNSLKIFVLNHKKLLNFKN